MIAVSLERALGGGLARFEARHRQAFKNVH